MPSSAKNKGDGFTIVKGKNAKGKANKGSVKFQEPTETKSAAKESKFTTKIRADFLTPNARESTTFHVVAALKGLTTAIFTASPSSAIVSRDSKEQFDKAENFPQTTAVKKYFDVVHTRGRSGTKAVTVVLEVKTEEKFTDIKYGALLPYIQRNKIFVEEHRFETNSITKIGAITLQHPLFINMDHFKKKLRTTLVENLKKVKDDGLCMDEDVLKFAESGQEIPKFDLKVGKLVAYPMEASAETNNKAMPKLETTAINVTGESHNLNTLRMLLLVLTQDDLWHVGRFIPFSWGRQHPMSFYTGVKEHMYFMDTLVKFALFNAHPKILAGQAKLSNDEEEVMTD